ncbi:MAG: hypothetical protein P1U77_17210 [Rubripirellula sp.]|jgi:type II secretory pathway component PulF|nr:hypothetical protein [Planctomycetaceae bacterium]MDF1843178.1 hypothetical protein [Rubripirellula sp.]
MNDPTNNPYRSPESELPPAKRISFVYLFACLAWCGFTLKMAILRPTAASFFEEFGIELPLLTQWLLGWEQTAFLVIITLGLLSSGLLVKTMEGRNRLGWRALAVAVVVLVINVLGIGVPLIKLAQALS